MRKFLILLTAILLILPGCAPAAEPAQIAATTLPVYEFTTALCQNTGITVTRLVTESVSCLHDYSLNVNQVKAAEAAQVIVISGAGLEDFMGDILQSATVIDSSQGIEPLDCHHDHDHGHHHETDSHIWLSPENAKQMARNICIGLSEIYPEQAPLFSENLAPLLAQLDALQAYGEKELSQLACRELITFHDGFSYLAHSFDLTILEAIEEESGSEASAKELIHLISQIEEHSLPAIFTERNGSVSAAGIISAETGIQSYPLDMAMAGNSYFDAMYHNINTLKEALG